MTVSASDQVLLDAAAQLRAAARQLVKFTQTTACTPEHERKVKSAVVANINAALARIQ